MKLRFTKFIFFIFLFTSIFIQQFHSKPVWLRKNVYVEYIIPRGKKNDGSVVYKFSVKTIYVGKRPVRIVNGTFIGNVSETPKPGYKPTVLCMLWGVDLINATYSWKIIDLNSTLAKVLVNFTALVRNMTTKIVKPFVKSVVVYIDVDTRDVYTLEGRYLGKISYWFPDIERSGSRVIVYKDPSIEINGTIYETLFNVSTPMGAFSCWSIASDEHPLYFFREATFYVDKVSGIPVAFGGGNYYDVILNYMNISLIIFPHSKDRRFPMILNRIEGMDLSGGGGGLDLATVVLLIGGSAIFLGILVIVLVKVFKVEKYFRR